MTTEHGAHCQHSSNQADWCETCRAIWIVNAHERFFKGLLIMLGKGCHHQWQQTKYADWEKCHCGVTRYTLF